MVNLRGSFKAWRLIYIVFAVLSPRSGAIGYHVLPIGTILATSCVLLHMRFYMSAVLLVFYSIYPKQQGYKGLRMHYWVGTKSSDYWEIILPKLKAGWNTMQTRVELRDHLKLGTWFFWSFTHINRAQAGVQLLINWLQGTTTHIKQYPNFEDEVFFNKGGLSHLSL